jgi:hypothetical protein
LGVLVRADLQQHEHAQDRGYDRRMSRRSFAVVAGVWLAILAVSAWVGFARPTPTERDQTTVAAARPVVDEAIARVAAAVADDGTGVVAISGFERVGACQISVVRDGERYRRGLVAMVTPGTEASLMDRVAGALPESYRAVVRRTDPPRLTADAGFWVLLSASITAPGEVRFLADTGDCRPAGDLDTGDTPPAEVPADAVPQVLSRLSLPAGRPTSASVSCLDGGRLGTVELRVAAYSGDLVAALSDLDGAVPVVRSARLYAFRIGSTEVAVRAHDDATIVTATTGCA